MSVRESSSSRLRTLPSRLKLAGRADVISMHNVARAPSAHQQPETGDAHHRHGASGEYGVRICTGFLNEARGKGFRGRADAILRTRGAVASSRARA